MILIEKHINARVSGHVSMLNDHLQDPISRYHPYRSHPEHQIAGLLDKYGLPFIYEKPTAVLDRGNVRLWYPDFTLSYGPVIEYFGVNGNEAYRQRTEHKLKVYEQNQIDVVSLYPRDLSGRWQDRLLARIDQSIENRLMSYRHAVLGRYRPESRPPPGSYSRHQ